MAPILHFGSMRPAVHVKGRWCSPHIIISNRRRNVEVHEREFRRTSHVILSDFPVAPPASQVDPQMVWNAVAMAYLGDSVWELYARQQTMLDERNPYKLHRKTVAKVAAECQSQHFETLLAGSFLTESEQDILKWGKNAKVKYPRRFLGEKRITYRQATAMECLVGYLYVSDPNRLQVLMQHLGMVGPPVL